MTAEPEQHTEPSATRLPPRFRPYLISRIVSVTGDGAALAALAVAVYQRHPTTVAVAGLFVARVLPRVAGPFTGHLADRVDLRRLLRLCDAVSATVYGLIVWTRPPYLTLLALVFLAELCAATSVPATRTVVPRMVPEELLGRANTWLTIGLALSLTVGAGLGGLLVTRFGPYAALAVDAASFAVAALLGRFLPRMRATPVPDGPALRSVGADIARLLSRRDTRVVVVGLVAVVFSAALDRPAVVFLTQSVLRTGPAGYGLTMATIGLGVLTSGLLLRFNLVKLSTGGFIGAICLQGVAHVAMGMSPNLAFLLGAMLVAGVGNGLEATSGLTLLQRSVRAQALGTSMGTVMSAMFLADAVASVVSGGPHGGRRAARRLLRRRHADDHHAVRRGALVAWKRRGSVVTCPMRARAVG